MFTNKGKIESLFQKIKPNDEFEIMFGNYSKDNVISLQQFLNALGYINARSIKDNLKTEISYNLDINYAYDTINASSYRLTIKNLDYLNQVMPLISNRKNHIIFSILANKIDQSNIELIRKDKHNDNKIDITDYDIRIRLSSETSIDQKQSKQLNLINLSESERFNIIFRYKQRTTLYLINTKECILKLDVTVVKMSNNINKINDDNILETYEIELECMCNKPSKTILDQILLEIELIKKSLEQTNNLIGKSLAKEITNKYKELVFSDIADKNIIKTLYLMQPITAEIQNITDTIPSKYSITDKADGDRYQLFIFGGKVYFLSTNLDVKFSGIEVDKKYDNTIIDGEYIYIPEHNKYLFLGFDVLYDSGKDIKNTVSLVERLQVLENLMLKCFGNKFKKTEFKGEFNINDLTKHYQIELKDYVNDLNISFKTKETVVIKSKYFIIPLGGNDCEIFTYSKVFWEVLNNNIFNLKLPYSLDGLLYTPIDQKYVRIVKEQKLFTYKWKPPHLNTIDFFITFEKDRETNKILNLYDDSYDTNEDEKTAHLEGEGTNESEIQVKGKVFRICNLQVGRYVDGIERPIPFKKSEEMHKCKLYLEDGQIKDSEGNAIMDNTVVEFSYDDGINIPEDCRWKPIRTRYDKTDSIKRYNIRYGNNEDIAEKIWRSIRNKVTIDDIIILGDPSRYEAYISSLRSKIDRSVISLEREQNAYYQLINKLGGPQRRFHNWIKDNMIYTYCGEKLLTSGSTKKMSVLDFGVGVGGDIMKFFHARIDYLVGIDIDANGLHYATNGALSRYNNFKSKFPKFPKMFFIQADVGTILKPLEQEKVIPRMTDDNKTLINRFFGDSRKKFDVINCQFMIHYLLRDDNTFNNMCENINMYLETDGYFLVSTMDADIVMDRLKKGNKKDTIYYTTTEGEKKICHEIVQKFNDPKDLKRTGLAIDLFNPEFMEEGNYYTEYLVQKDFLTEELYKKCKLVLIESDLFENKYKIDKEFLTNIGKYDNNEKSKKNFADIADFYDTKQEMNISLYEATKLFRYYIFQKI